MSQKTPRSVQDFQIEICEIAQKIGLLEYQREREIPLELEKLYNRMHDLDREGKKMLKAAQAQGQEVQLPKQEEANTSDTPTTPDLSVVPSASN